MISPSPRSKSRTVDFRGITSVLRNHGYRDISAKVQTRRNEEVKSEKIYNLQFYKRSKVMK